MPDVDINPAEFPSNSLGEKRVEKAAPVAEEPKTKKVITGSIIKKKRSFLDNISQTFFGEDTHSVGRYIWWDVLIPAAKNTISEMVSSGIEMLLFGEARSHGTRKDRDRPYVSYGDYYRNTERREDRKRIYHSHTDYRFDDLLISSGAEASEVLEKLLEILDQYQAVSVADLYDALGIEGTFADNKYGWRNLNRASVRRVRDGYILDLPRATPLD